MKNKMPIAEKLKETISKFGLSEEGFYWCRCEGEWEIVHFNGQYIQYVGSDEDEHLFSIVKNARFVGPILPPNEEWR